ncbi:hypothetical protein BDQ17DRAFT_257206 [Cyathus striatus]|nr:hypothetical protein BDQ17DRAFT_257206 [Cyathus striatus]
MSLNPFQIRATSTTSFAHADTFTPRNPLTVPQRQVLKPLGFLRNMPFWDRQNTAMDTVPTSLMISMPYFSQRATWGGRFDTSSDLLFSNGTFMSLRAYAMSFNNIYPWLESSPPASVQSQQSIDNPQIDLSQVNFTATDDIYTLLCTRIRSFVNLRELVFQNNALPGEVYDVIKNLPSLRKLVFNRCYLPEPAFAQPDEFIELPITELVIKRIKDEDSTQRYRYRRALRICYAPNITTLDIDWDPISARILAGLLLPDSPDKPLPLVAPHLHTFYLYSAGNGPRTQGLKCIVHLKSS